MACVTAVVVIGFTIWALRQGRRRRAAGYQPDLPALQLRLRRRMRWHVPLALLTVVACGVALATKDNTTPTWVLVAPAVLMLVGLALLWVFTEYLLPKSQRKQEDRSDGTPT